MKKFKQCCLCFDLRSGVKIISILWIMYAIIAIVSQLIVEDYGNDDNEGAGGIVNITGNQNLTTITNDGDDDNTMKFRIATDIDYLILIFSIVEIFLSILLYIGVVKDKYKLMIPWLIVTMLEILYTFFHSIIILFGFFILSLNAIGVAYLIFILFVFPFQLYLWYCVYSLYYKLKHEVISAV